MNTKPHYTHYTHYTTLYTPHTLYHTIHTIPHYTHYTHYTTLYTLQEDDLTRKYLGKMKNMNLQLDAPEDASIVTLWFGGIDPETTEVCT